MLPQPSLQWALCLWSALRRGSEGHQRGAAAAGLRRRQLTQSQHCPRAPCAGHVSGRHPRRTLEGDMWPPASADRQVARPVRGLKRWGAGGFWCPIWSNHESDGMRMGKIYCPTSHYPLNFQWGRVGNNGDFCREGYLKWCHSISHVITCLWSYWGSVGRVGHDKGNPIALNNPKDCHRKSPGNMQHHLHGKNQSSR